MYRYTIEGDNVVVSELTDFDLEQTLECGQAFHFDKLDEQDYIVVAKRKMLHISQKGEKNNVELTFHNTTYEEFDTVWRDYFDLDRDYASIKKELLAKDDKLKEAITTKWGVRIMNQEFFEMLMSFIISQNKQIPHIKQLVFRISECYGTVAGEYNKKVYYNFPTVAELSKVQVEDYINMKTGFRAPYLYDAVRLCLSGEIDENNLVCLGDEEVMKELMKIKGVGAKVANCVMLFSLSRRSSFPVDVWIKKIMEKLYFGEEISKEKIMEFAKERFGNLGGYAQQYLFYYARSL